MHKGTITVTANAVTKITTEAGNNGHVKVEKLAPDTFFCSMGDESGGGQATGTLQSTLLAFEKGVAESYKKLFALENPTEETISEAGFKDYKIIFK